MRKFALFLLAACIWSVSSHAQLKYENGRLTFGNVQPYSYYTTRFEAWGHYFSYGNKFLEICVATASPRIAGTGGQIVFYNSETSTFNSIQVASILNFSDRRAKTNIVPLSYGLQTVMKLKPVTYDWKDPNNGIKDLQTGVVKSNIGFISQDVEEILPQLVYTDPKGHKLLNYIGIIPILTKSIQELKVRVDSLQQHVEALRAKAKTTFTHAP